MTAACVLVTVPPVAVNVPVVAPAATVTLTGTVRRALLLLSATAAPPVRAGPLSVTVQELVPGPVSAAGLQLKLLTVTGAFSIIEALALPPLAVAVTVAVALLAIVPAVAEKVALLAPAATATVAGTVSAAELLESATATPPAGAAALTVTVHVLLPPDDNAVGVQLSAVTATGGARLSVAV